MPYQQSVTACSLAVLVHSITRILYHQGERSEDSGMLRLGPTLGLALRVSGIAAVQRLYHDHLPEAGIPIVPIVSITDLSLDLI